uniref:Potassium/proton antiporter CemA n=1 Tax=Oltmannsiellopsis viridis TaxID=51324 RepID=CEMA_OLTVI|nr:envelope membrane protein [Oltmannsiellopsis viridis]Q20EU1.1 RecName: Full=Potassium/proton antiporter CemA; AltName: Full=Chloroplast envelope membrane protein A; Short=CemA [Oltmannsiellopsis viridis]ABB81972.1 chloroplast enveloppe membrane protein [Oltmannsiellopsis viridis]
MDSESQLLEGAVEKIGLIPRSIIRTINRFQQQLFPDAVEYFIQEFRVSRSQVLVSLQCLLTLIIIPLFIHFFAKTVFLTPCIEYVWNTYKTDIFLNSYQQEQALTEMRNFEEILYFDLLVQSNEEPVTQEGLPFTFLQHSQGSVDEEKTTAPITAYAVSNMGNPETATIAPQHLHGSVGGKLESEFRFTNPSFVGKNNVTGATTITAAIPLQKKLVDLAQSANKQSIAALTNLFADLLTLFSLIILFIRLKSQIIILKSFLIETFYSLNDTTKSFMLIFSTDLLVGFHSPRGWEIFLDFILSRFGLPHDENIILLFVATFPVLLDSVIKYWIFRYLNKISPSTVATYHAMIE